LAVQQSGNITPNHLAVWTTDGVIQDGGPVINVAKILGTIRGADFNSSADQPIYLPATVTAFQILDVTVTNASLSLTAATGGIYPNANKTGTAIVAANQVYSLLTSSSKLLSAITTGASDATRYSSANVDTTLLSGQNVLTIYLSLTNVQGLHCFADVYVVGLDLS